MRLQRKKSQSGTSMVESIVAIALLSISILAISKLSVSRIKLTKASINIGQEDDLRRYLRQNLDCSATFSDPDCANSLATVPIKSCNGDNLHGAASTWSNVGKYAVRATCGTSIGANQIKIEATQLVDGTPGTVMFDPFRDVPVMCNTAGGGGMTSVVSGAVICGVLAGQVVCTGLNRYGVAGAATPDVLLSATAPTSTHLIGCPQPVQNLPAGEPDKLFAGEDNVCALYGSNLWCWGRNYQNVITPSWTLIHDLDAHSVIPVQVNVGGTPVSVSFSDISVCVALTNGEARCWGYGLEGGLGTGEPLSSESSEIWYPSHSTPQDVIGYGPGSGVTKIETGGLHTCLIAGDAVACFGRSMEGQLGTGAAANLPGPPYSNIRVNTPVTPVGLGPGSGATDIAVGNYHSCAVVDGGVKCWGANGGRQSGQPTGNYIITPEWVVGLGAGSGVTAIGSSQNYNCVIVNGGVQCWGTAFTGILGATDTSATPISIPGLSSGVSSIEVGAGNVCAVKSGTTYCWGYDAFGSLSGTTEYDDTRKVLTPVQPGCDIGPPVESCSFYE